RKGGTVGRRRDPEGAGEARRERPDALKPDVEADPGDRIVRVAEKRGSTFHAPRQQVRVGRLAEGAPELAAEVRAREACGTGEVIDAQRLEVAGVGEILGP